ncbi:MAG: MBL fold metallo-hydrolase, partial [Gemmatimonadetes bacterium]|nr:MBL fold metallo-hydrolase [Gemmatimonadota bacterium]
MSRPSAKKSAVAIPVTRAPGGELRVLVGRRRSRFLGGFFAFPGGATEPEDGDPETDEDGCLRQTAARELREETGLNVEATALLDAGRRVTPPFFPRRFDTLMYVAVVDHEVEPTPETTEMEDLHWDSPAEVYRRWGDLEIRVAPPLIPMLHDLAEIRDEPYDAIAARLRATNDRMEAGNGPRIEFVPDVLMVPMDTVTLPPATTTNCYLVGSREFAILDPGGRGAEVDRLLVHVKERVAEGGTPVAVVLTHHHGDHTGGVAAVARALDVPVIAHETTWRLWGGDGLPAEARRTFADGDVLELNGGERLRALFTPGHAAGHLAFLEERRGSLFAGDLVSGLSTILVDSGPGALDEFLASLERIRDCGARTLFPAHGPPMISPERDVQRVLDHRREREDKIVAALEDGAQPLDTV